MQINYSITVAYKIDGQPLPEMNECFGIMKCYHIFLNMIEFIDNHENNMAVS